MKAAFLLNFARFTEWAPTAFADPEAPLIVCTFAENPFGDTLANTGLALARRIVELHGGTIRIESPGLQRGTTVTVMLPAFNGKQAYV